MTESKIIWGKDPDGKTIELFTIGNDHGIEVKISSYGATITSIKTPDSVGDFSEIALGFDSADAYFSEFYKANCPYFGCIAGRYANRIAKGKFQIDGKEYALAVNNGENALHGGIRGFDKHTWDGKLISENGNPGVELSYLSPHLEEGYPGNLLVKVTYLLNNNHELHIRYAAETDRATIINLTNHTYFNLTGCHDNIFSHKLTINSSKQIESNNLIPTGKLVDAGGTIFDFSKGKPIGQDIAELSDGYDTGFALETVNGKPVIAAILSEETTGRMVEVSTNQPAVHVYTGYYIPELKGHNDTAYGRYMGVAIETQHFPDSPNHSNFPSTLLQPGEKFESETIFRFGLL
ncbi:MAG: galactose mutarotase [Bacteroidales bacterium]|nr:galactose mutarotase [Bacteroidales bacterium]